MFMILLVLHQTEKLNDILSAWDEAGASGVTILPSTGLGRIRRMNGLREDMPLFPSLEDILRPDEVANRTIFTIVENEEFVDRILEATQQVTGDLNLPNTGILAVIPVARCYGLHRKEASDDENSDR
jgi:nitrogen regulatory protein PII